MSRFFADNRCFTHWAAQSLEPSSAISRTNSLVGIAGEDDLDALDLVNGLQ
jgi:hypothetical protein